MEVVVLGIANGNEEDKGVNDGCKSIVSTDSVLVELAEGVMSVRLPLGFLPKCLAWYRPRRPLALTSGAAPRGSFS